MKLNIRRTEYESLTHNNLFPMRDWHVKHMQDTVINYLTGLSEDASRWQKRLNKQYGNLAQVIKRIDYDIKHGVELWSYVNKYKVLIALGSVCSIGIGT